MEKLKNINRVFSIFEPHSWAVKPVLRSNVPISAKQTAIDPQIALLIGFHIDIGVSNLL
jgi:hypothetical protein